jgi:rubrerythrin
MRKIKLNEWATLRVMSKKEFEKEFPDSEQEQINPETDLDNDPDINPETDVEGDEETSETSEALADALKRVANNQVRTNARDLSRLHVSERKANQPALAPEAPRTPNETSDALAAAIRKLRETA